MKSVTSEDPSKKIYIIDGTSWIFKSYFVIDYMESPSGLPVNAVFGWSMMMLRFLRKYKPVYIAVAFDAGLDTFRNKIYDQYKANRGLPPDDLKHQFDLCMQACECFGIPAFKKVGYEADDLLASMANDYSKKGYYVEIVSNDKDLGQVVDDTIHLFDSKTGDSKGVDNVFSKMGVKPNQLIDFQALTGDSIDNIPGIKGIGVKAAQALLALGYPVAELKEKPELLQHLVVRGKDSVIRKFLEGYEDYLLSKKLVTLKIDVKGNWKEEKVLWQGPKKKKSELFFDELGFSSISEKINNL